MGQRSPQPRITSWSTQTPVQVPPKSHGYCRAPLGSDLTELNRFSFHLLSLILRLLSRNILRLLGDDPLNAVPVAILCVANFNVKHANMLIQTFDKLNCEHIRRLFYCKGITRTHTDKDNLQSCQDDPQPTHLLESKGYFHRFRWAYVSMLKTCQINMFLVSTVV